MTVSFCPPLYPDELPYSFFARYKASAGYEYDTDVWRDFYGKPIVALELIGFIPFPEEVRRNVLDWLPKNETIISRHTLLPTYGAFLEQSRVSDKKSGALLVGPLLRSVRLRQIDRERRALGLAYCPECVKADYTNYGESYWRRLHNLYGVFVCPTHRIHLERFGLEPRPKGGGLVLPPRPDQLVRTRTVIEEMPDQAFLIDLANDLALLIDHHDIPGLRSSVASTIKTLLRESGLDYNGNASVSLTSRLLNQRITAEALKAFHIQSPRGTSTSWCQRFTAYSDHLDPVAVAVTLRVLGSSFGDVISAIQSSREKSHRSRRNGDCWTPSCRLVEDNDFTEHRAWPISCAPQVAQWQVSKIRAGVSRSRKVLTQEGPRCLNENDVCLVVSEAIQSAQRKEERITCPRLARLIGIPRQRLDVLLEEFPLVRRMITQALEDADQCAKRKIRRAIERRLIHGEPLTPIEVMYQTNTHKWYWRLKSFILEEIERQSAITGNPSNARCA